MSNMQQLFPTIKWYENCEPCNKHWCVVCYKNKLYISYQHCGCWDDRIQEPWEKEGGRLLWVYQEDFDFELLSKQQLINLLVNNETEL